MKTLLIIGALLLSGCAVDIKQVVDPPPIELGERVEVQLLGENSYIEIKIYW